MERTFKGRDIRFDAGKYVKARLYEYAKFAYRVAPVILCGYSQGFESGSVVFCLDPDPVLEFI